jgi:hypothetical protein
MDEIDQLLKIEGDRWRMSQAAPAPISADLFVGKAAGSSWVLALAWSLAGMSLVLLVGFVLAASGHLTFNWRGAQPTSGPCPVTVPTPVFIPPAPWPSSGPGDNQWFGSAALWTMLPPNGLIWHWSGTPPPDEPGITEKSFWWSSEYTNSSAEPQPALRITAIRLDGEGSSITEPPATNATAPDIGLAMLTGLTIPSRGCWQVTGEYRGHTLAYVMLVTD